MQSWRAESAEAREKAERERAKWEDIRAREKALAPKAEEAKGGDDEIEPSPADVRDLVTGEKQVGFKPLYFVGGILKAYGSTG